MSSQVATWYGANIVGVGQRDGGAEVEDVGGAGLALELLGGGISSALLPSGWRW